MSSLPEEQTKNKKKFFRRDPVSTVFYVLGVFLLSQLIAGLLISVYPAVMRWSGEQGADWLDTSVYAQFFYILIAEIAVVWLVLKAIKTASVKNREIGIKRPRLKDVVYAFSGYGAYFVVYVVVVTIASSLSSLIDLDQPQKIGFEEAYGAVNLAVVYVSLAILPPIAEEVLFRGFLFTSLRRKYKFLTAAIFTSVLFGIAHLQFGSGAPLLWVAFIDTFILSIVLCYLRETTKSLWASIILHGLKNSIAYVVLFHTRF